MSVTAPGKTWQINPAGPQPDCATTGAAKGPAPQAGQLTAPSGMPRGDRSAERRAQLIRSRRIWDTGSTGVTDLRGPAVQGGKGGNLRGPTFKQNPGGV